MHTKRGVEEFGHARNDGRGRDLGRKDGERVPEVDRGPSWPWLRRIEEKGALDAKTKELISVALAVATQCKWCVAIHTKNPLEAGNTQDEIMEACFVGAP